MAFTKAYFDSFQEELLRRFKTTGLTVTVRLINGERYNVATITSRTDEVISFALYGNKEGASSDPLPMMGVPYSAILAIEVKAAKATKAKAGFQFSTEQQKQ
jgi:hypothetical protein